MNKLLLKLICLCLLLCGYAASGQTVQLKGTVSDAAGPLPGVTVSVKNSTIGTQTDNNGKFSFSVPGNATLVFKLIGYIEQEVALNGRSEIKIVLKEDSKQLEEVVVMGYTTAQTGKISGSVAVVKAEELRDVTASDVDKMLQGKVSGVFVGSGSSQPGEKPTIRIRGNTTVTAGADPLYVVDGIIGGIPNPNDVESVTVLKDAAATTLYGARASNGVVVITTKRGKAGKTNFDFRINGGFAQLNNGNFKLMNSTQLYDTYAKALTAAYTGDPSGLNAYIEGLLPSSRKNVNTDWQDVAFRNGINTNYELGVSGGSEKTRFYLGGNYYKEEGIVVGSGIDRYSFRLNMDHSINDKFKISGNIASTLQNKENSSPDAALYQSYTNLPWDRAFDDNGAAIDPNVAPEWFGRDFSNFAFERQYNYNKSRDLNFEGVLKGEYFFTNWLSFSTSNRAELGNGFNENYNDIRSTSGSYTNGYLYNYNSDYRTYLTSNLLKFNRSFDNHQIDGLFGQEYQYNTDQYSDVTMNGLLPTLDVLSTGAQVVNSTGLKNTSKFLSFFLQGNYNYKGKYFFTSSFRRDGSSRFGSNNRYANFYAVGGSWILSEEDFMKNISFINFLKVRTSYGTTGNAEIRQYVNGSYSLNNYGGIGYYKVDASYNDMTAAYPFQLENKDLTWEKTASFDFGIDLGVLNNRISFTADYYNKNTSDLLFNVLQPSNVGIGAKTLNVGSVRNTGFEFGVVTKNFTKAFKWDTEFNISFNNNKVTELYNDLPFASNQAIGNQRLIVGQDMHTWYMRKWAGVDPANGDPLWEVVTTDPQTGKQTITTTNTYSKATLQTVGTATPDFFGGLRNTFSYKGFELNAFLNFVSGNEIYNGNRALFDSDGAYNTYNMMQLQDGWSRWEKPGDIATHPKLVNGGNKNAQRPSSRFIEDGSYLRIRNVTLSYALKESLSKRIGVRSAKFSIGADNLYTWTKFSGIDPEVDDNGSVGFKYPYSRKFILGVQLGF